MSIAPMSVHHSVPATSSEPCEPCKKTTHCSKNCFARFPKKLADFRACCATRARGTTSTSGGSVSVAVASPVGAP
uniref:Uncharacterized protein n=1 Tax=Arundo donax TaxID=35708 RepID=A0A0A8ZR64_ARUDO